MDEVASRVKLVDAESPNAEGHVLTATVPRSQIEAALADDAGADLRLEIARIQNGERDDRVVDVSWDRADLEELLRKASGDPVLLTFDPNELERMLETPDVEAQGIREKALVITVAAATAAGFSGAAQAMTDIGGGGSSSAAVSGLVTDNASGQPGAVSGFVTDASTSGATDPAAASVPADGWMSGVESPVAGDAASSVPADGWMSGVESPVAGDAGINVVTDVTSSGQPGAVSGFATDASTSGQPDAVPGFITDASSERTRTPAEPSGGGGFSIPDPAAGAALAGGIALLLTGAAFIGRTQRRRETTA